MNSDSFMMIGSSDILALAKEEYADVLAEQQVMAEKLAPPLSPHVRDATPWSSSSCARFVRDFVLVSEFSEQVGPQPLFTVPEDSFTRSPFDLNRFSLRIMSVDYQPPGGGACSRQPIRFVEDSHVLLGDSKESAYAYVHHLMLHDVAARGFVRPVCLAYVSTDERKLLQELPRLLAAFGHASECLKTGNRKVFARQLEQQLGELERQRQQLHQEEGEESCPGGGACDLATVESTMLDLTVLLQQVASYPGRKREQPDFLPYPMPPPTARPSPRPQQQKPLDQLCDAYFFLQTMQQLRAIQRRFRGDAWQLSQRRTCDRLLHQLSVTNFLFEEPSEAEEDDGAVGGAFSPCDPAAVDSFVSCVEMVPIKLQMESCGPVSLVLHNVQSQQTPALACCHHDDDVTGEVVQSQQTPALACCRHDDDITGEVVQSQQTPALACCRHDDNITGEVVQSQQTPALACCRHDDNITGEVVQSQQTPALACCRHDDDVVPSGSVSSGDSFEVLGTERSFRVQELSLAAAHSAPRHAPEAGPPRVYVRREDSRDSIEVLSVTIVPDDLRPLCTPCTIHEEEEHHEGPLANQVLFGAAPLLEDTVDGASFSSCPSSLDSDSTYLPSYHGNRAASRRGPGSSGHASLSFVRRFRFARHVLYSLMIGRATVVLGRDEAAVRQLVDSLSLFLPNAGPAHHRVLPWCCRALQTSDLMDYGIIGLNRAFGPSLPSMPHCLQHYARYVSILDADQKTFCGPAYCGSLIGRLTDQSPLGHGRTYCLWVQSALTRLAARAFLFTFSQGPARRREKMEPDRSHDQGGVDCDWHIVHFLSELIKLRLTEAPPTVLMFRYQHRTLFKL
ncbi:guanine nucleotide exchange protein smcr8a-like [Denticeps clupeoides]|uniref:guanine nucleotide exchange protein smcr8a-like n=1 Tax=Denticeps clupeoides TaxID=299321 RepID=UPI0010A3ACBE|nr:guanine nucleotide exchange protein smcr8a-like [Denticeps clupeoides]XP_028829743.1 guanine nucleotide exchange protein smcr8a-like [Denticeps clupeoides]